jgi:hypothetical protein
VVHDELNHQVDKYDEDEHQPALPAKEVKTQEDAGQQRVDEGPGDGWPVSSENVAEGNLSFSSPFDGHDKKEHAHSAEQSLSYMVVGETEQGTMQKFARQDGNQGG